MLLFDINISIFCHNWTDDVIKVKYNRFPVFPGPVDKDKYFKTAFSSKGNLQDFKQTASDLLEFVYWFNYAVEQNGVIFTIFSLHISICYQNHTGMLITKRIYVDSHVRLLF